MTDKTKEKIQYLCPDVMFAANPAKWIITLAVVLRAIGDHYAIEGGGRFFMYDKDLDEWRPNGIKATWNLAEDNYDQQSEETKRFIGELLGI